MPDAPLTWSVVMPVKRLELAKTRLAASAALRAELALAFACDTASAALSCPRVAELVVVTDDPDVSSALAGLGAVIVPDADSGGLNSAIRLGTASVSGAPGGVAVLLSDLPALRAGELDAALAQAAPLRHAMVADATGKGTTLLAAGVGVPLDPAFGRASHARHLARGARDIQAAVPSLRRDVDTAEDLACATLLGLGRQTAAVCTRAGLTGSATGLTI